MAVRVTATEVKAILDVTELTDPQVEAYVVSANVMVNNALGTGTTAILKEIERWVTAHMIAITKERQALKEGAGGAEITYTGTYGSFLRSTSYGQMAMALDAQGKLAAYGGKNNASIYAIKSFD